MRLTFVSLLAFITTIGKVNLYSYSYNNTFKIEKTLHNSLSNEPRIKKAACAVATISKVSFYIV